MRVPGTPKILILTTSLRIGGLERVMVNLANEFVKRNCDTSLVTFRGGGELGCFLDQKISVIDLAISNTYYAIPKLARIFRATCPDAILAGQPNINIAAILARLISGHRGRLTVSEHSTLSLTQKSEKRISVRLRKWGEQVFYPLADEIVAVSHGVADDMSQEIGIPRQQIKVIYNPVVTQDLIRLANLLPPHPWFANKIGPIILAVGRLAPAKDYPTLVKAFYRLHRDNNKARLIILGEGPERLLLEHLITSFKLQDAIDLPGVDANPYSYMAQSDVLVLSSAWEGFGIVLVEALACGTPVVSTDCQSGPAEILMNGKYGRLVSVGDEEGMVTAILETLANPPDKAVLIERAQEFSASVIAERYLELLLTS